MLWRFDAVILMYKIACGCAYVPLGGACRVSPKYQELFDKYADVTYRYVMRFDPDFASQYIERYAKNEFAENERSNMGEISPGYIAKIARGLAEKY